jgi:hypothetical protein
VPLQRGGKEGRILDRDTPAFGGVINQ